MDQPERWRGWVLLALADSPDGSLDSEAAVVEEVAVRFGDRFSPDDRDYDGEQPRWHGAVHDALRSLRSERLVFQRAQPAQPAPDRPASSGPLEAEDPPPVPQQVTPAGRRRSESVRGEVERDWQDRQRERDEAAESDRHAGTSDAPEPLLTAGVISPPLRSEERWKVGFPRAEDVPGPVMAEINLQYAGGPEAAFARLRELWVRVTGDPGRAPTPLAEEYATGELSMNEMKRLVSADAASIIRSARSLRRLWPDFPVKAQVDASCITVKADAARRAFNAHGDRIVWAVIDSGVWAAHPHFCAYDTLTHESVKDLHRFFPRDGDATPEPALALTDESGHGTHVAGIIAGGIGPWLDADPAARRAHVTESRYNAEKPLAPIRMPRVVGDHSLLAGMSPKTKLVSLKVLDSAGGTLEARTARVMRALAYVRKVNGESTESMRIHGVNLSLGYEFNPQWFACGKSPLCKEVDKLVRSGVVVVVAAGNSGYGSVTVLSEQAPNKFGLGMTINDPGNADLAITVGSTHRDAPHAYGVSYFSSKGPTGDGRRKPDLVAPGERITSCAAGSNLTAVFEGDVPAGTAVYVEETGTSMAAPHVSGATAALLSVRREFIGRPDAVKRIIVDACTSLGRSTDFEGAGLLDLMRALQSV